MEGQPGAVPGRRSNERGGTKVLWSLHGGQHQVLQEGHSKQGGSRQIDLTVLAACDCREGTGRPSGKDMRIRPKGCSVHLPSPGRSRRGPQSSAGSRLAPTAQRREAGMRGTELWLGGPGARQAQERGACHVVPSASAERRGGASKRASACTVHGSQLAPRRPPAGAGTRWSTRPPSTCTTVGGHATASSLEGRACRSHLVTAHRSDGGVGFRS